MSLHTWPPPPNIPAAPPAHDAFLTACILDAPKKQVVTRLALAMKLRRESCLDRRQCRTVVADFCDRHRILPLQGRAEIWAMRAWNFIILAVFVALEGFLWLLARENRGAVTDLERRMIFNRVLNIRIPMLSTMAVIVCISIVLGIYGWKRIRRNTAHARETLSAHVAAQN